MLLYGFDIIFIERSGFMVERLEDTKKAVPLFGDWQETLIWSCLQQVMGSIYADDLENPRSAMAHLGDFMFFAGEPNRELALYQPKDYGKELVLKVPQNEEWAGLLRDCYGSRARWITRYAMKKEPRVFDRDRLQAFIRKLPWGCCLELIGEDLFYRCREQEWSRDLVSQYPEFAQYQALGLGVVALKDGKIVAGASSYSSFRDGIEIEVDTVPEQRRRGLATACCARLILECQDRGWYPSWDAHNRWSVGLAEKLGYHFSHEYDCCVAACGSWPGTDWPEGIL